MPRTGLTPEQITEKSIDIAEAKLRLLGFGRVHLVDIAREVGVSHVALYKHFPDKDALFDAVSKRWTLRSEQQLGEIVTRDQPVKERISEWFLTLHRLKHCKVSTDPELFKAYDMATEIKKEFVIQHVRILHDQLNTLVREGRDQGLWESPSDEEISCVLFDGMIGFHHPKLVLQYLDQDREPALRQTLSTLLRGLAR